MGMPAKITFEPAPWVDAEALSYFTNTHLRDTPDPRCAGDGELVFWLTHALQGGRESKPPTRHV